MEEQHKQGTIDNSKVKILIVDDTPANLDILHKALAPLCYKLAVATEGAKALELATDYKPDLILLDIMMPEMDGYEVCRKLKANQETQDIPVIFLSAKIDAEDKVKGFKIGAVDYVTKPFALEELISRVQTHIKLRFYIQQLHRISEEKNFFVGMVAHDLRNPLTSIYGFSEFLLDEGEAEISASKRQDILRSIAACSIEMLSMVNSLLDLSAIESGQFKLQLEDVQLDSLAQRRILVHKFRADQKNIQFEFKSTKTSLVRCDPNRINQVIDNIIGNALKYSPINSKVYISIEDQKDVVILKVRDQGEGFMEEEKNKLFEQYSHSASKPTDGEKSTGLGLSIAKIIIMAHNGTIGIDSAPSKGAEVYFTLNKNKSTKKTKD